MVKATKKVAKAAEGTKPKSMSKARAGGADDLTVISGIGPKIHGQLNAMGVYHYDQVARLEKSRVRLC